MMIRIIPPLLLCLLCADLQCQAFQLCEATQVWSRGRDVVSSMRGELLLVAFPKPDPASLDKISEMASRHPHVKAIALLEQGVPDETVTQLNDRYQKILVDRDEAGSRQRLGLEFGDIALIDRCGRLARTLSSSSQEELHYALKDATHHASCGWCSYGKGGVQLQRPANNAAQKPQQHHHHRQHHQHLQQQQEQSQQQHQQHQHHQQHTQHQQHHTHEHQHRQQQHEQHAHHQKSHQQRREEYEEQLRQRAANQQQAHQAPVHHRVVEPVNQQTQQRQTETVRSANTDEDYANYDLDDKAAVVTTPSEDLRSPSFNRDAKWEPAAPFHRPQQTPTPQAQSQDLFGGSAVSPSSRRPSSRGPSKMSSPPLFSSPPSVKTTPPPVFEDYSQYDETPVEEEETKPMEKIMQEEREAQEIRRVISSRALVDVESQDDEEVNLVEVPCKAITDDICYHQKKSGRKLSRCCKKGVYLADFCIPGKCSNTTTQACCMQKYLQARYMCCEEPSMDGSTATDAFSRCCFAGFVGLEDECCPPSAAHSYWGTVSDICFPNTNVDLTSVKLEVRLTDGIRIVDLSDKEKWQHECKYGAKRAQFVYIPMP